MCPPHVSFPLTPTQAHLNVLLPTPLPPFGARAWRLCQNKRIGFFFTPTFLHTMSTCQHGMEELRMVFAAPSTSPAFFSQNYGAPNISIVSRSRPWERTATVRGPFGAQAKLGQNCWAYSLSVITVC